MSSVKIKEIKIRDGDEFFSYTKFEDVPESFDNLIKFDVAIPEGPHTPEQHKEIEKSQKWFKDIFKREKR
jgi:hypothetical protein